MKGGIFIASSLFAIVAVHAEGNDQDPRRTTVTSRYYVDTELDTLKAKTINGIELGTGGYFFANEASTDTAETCAKTLDGNDITLQELNAGQIITVKPRYTSNCGNNTALSLRVPLDGQAQLTGPTILYNGTPVRGATQTLVWTVNVPSTFVYDGTNWLFMGHGVDIDTDTNTVPAYGTSDTGASATIKSVTVPTGTELVSGQIITIKPTTTTSATTLFISLDSGITGKKVRYNGSDIGNADTAAKVWNADYVSTFMYDGTAWNFIASTKDTSADLASLASHTVNGAPLSNAASYFYGTSSTAADTAAKTVTISSIADARLATGQIITVKPTATSTASGSYTLQLNPGDSNSSKFKIYYNGAEVTDAATGALIWNQNYPSTFVYDGTNWVFLGHGVDNSIGYAHSPTAAATPTKAVSIPSITSLSTGQMITVWPEHTSSADNQTHKIQLNSLAAKDIFYKGVVVSALGDGQAVWNESYPSTFVYDAAANSGNGAWVFVSKGYDANQTYSTLEWNNTQGTAIDAYNTTFGSGNNNWAGNGGNLITGKFLANALARKQNNITAADADPWNDSTTFFPALVSNTASGGINGNAYGVIDQATITGDNWSLGDFTDNNNATATDKLVPTVRAVATWLTNLLPTGTSSSAVIYNGTNSDGVPQFTEREIFTGGEPQYTANDADKLPTAQYVHSKQNHVPATDVQYISNAAATQTNPLTAVRQKADGAVFIPYQNGGNGEIGQRGVAVEYAEYTENGQTYNNEGWLATIGAARKIASAALPTGTAGNVVIYNSNGKIGGSRGIYNGSGQFDTTYLATAGFVNTKQGLINAVTTNASAKPLLAPVVTYPTGSAAAGAITESLVAGNFPNGDNNAPMLIVGETTANAMAWFIGKDEDNDYAREINSLNNEIGSTDIEKALVSLNFASGMYQDIQTAMGNLQPKIPTGTSGTVVTYNGVINGVQQFSEKAIYNGSPAYSSNYAANLATAGFVNTKQNKLPARTTTLNSVPSDSVGETIKLTSNSGALDTVYITAGGLTPLTKTTGAPNVINYVKGTTTPANFTIATFGLPAQATSMTIEDNQTRIDGALVSLELLKDVYTALHTEATAAPTGTNGNVAMYDANTGALGNGVATYDGSTQYDASTDAGKIAVMSGVQRKKECAGYEPAAQGQPAHDGSHAGDEDYCWLWIFPN